MLIFNNFIDIDLVLTVFQNNYFRIYDMYDVLKLDKTHMSNEDLIGNQSLVKCCR